MVISVEFLSHNIMRRERSRRWIFVYWNYRYHTGRKCCGFPTSIQSDQLDCSMLQLFPCLGGICNCMSFLNNGRDEWAQLNNAQVTRL